MRAFILLVVIGFTACTTDRVVVDPRGLNRAAYEKDLAECRALKHQVPVGVIGFCVFLYDKFIHLDYNYR